MPGAKLGGGKPGDANPGREELAIEGSDILLSLRRGAVEDPSPGL